jgi:hypothetical protein
MGVVFSSDRLVMWLTFVAELIVAWVIYLELETTRRTNYIAATNRDEANEARGFIYSKYLEITAPTLEERSKLFVARMYHDPELKLKCDRQIELFNSLGLIISSWFTQKKSYVRIFPHAAIYIWIILQQYIVSRRSDAGQFFAEPMLTFALRCTKFLIKKDHPLHLRKSDGTDGLTIAVEDLKQIRDKLKGELKRKV